MRVTGLADSLAGATNIEKDQAEGTEVFKKMFAGLLHKRMATLTETLDAMNKRQEELEQLKAQQNFSEVIRHILPDGSVLVKEYVNGKLDSCYRKPPHLKSVPDESKPVPLAADGTELKSQRKLKQVPAVRIFEDL